MLWELNPQSVQVTVEFCSHEPPQNLLQALSHRFIILIFAECNVKITKNRGYVSPFLLDPEPDTRSL